ncbi:MAG: FUSC family protein, partial [Actinomycetales bacterium]
AVLTVGVLLAGALWLAVLGAFIVSATFGYLRVLRGYVARAAVGLQCAFFLPLMTDANLASLPNLLAAWLIGGTVAMVAGLVVLPKYRDGSLRAGLAAWLNSATAMAGDLADGRPLDGARAHLQQATGALVAMIAGPRMRPGAIGSRQRALAEMIDVVRWSGPVLAQLQPLPAGARRALADQSTEALARAAEVVQGRQPTTGVPDLPSIRAADLRELAEADPTTARSDYTARLLSILAMGMLWLAGRSTGRRYPTPDVGCMADERPLALLRVHARLDSPWLRNALRTGACAAACVLIVRLMGLEHGVWVVLAALSVTQVSFSGMANGASALRMVAGATAGVLIASLGLLLDFPQAIDLAIVPIAAFLAVVGAAIGPFTAQMMFTPFVLANFAAIQYATQRGLELVRLEDVAIGAAVAAVFAFMVFPFGLARELQSTARASREAAASFLVAALAASRGQAPEPPGELRRTAVAALARLEATLDAAHISGDVSEQAVSDAGYDNALARDRMVGGLGASRCSLHQSAN